MNTKRPNSVDDAARARKNMSLKAQIALGKNISLQKQLDTKVVDFKKSFKTSRRRLDALEEECVASLYKLLLYGKAKQELDENENENDHRKVKSAATVRRPQSVFDTTKTPEITNENPRPYTAMSARTYTQSYSFMKDGLNIGKNRKDRFVSSRKQKKQIAESEVMVERRKRPSNQTDTPQPFLKEKENSESTVETESQISQKNSMTPGPHAYRHDHFRGQLRRPQTSNSLLVPGKLNMKQRASTPATDTYTVSPLSASHIQHGSARAASTFGTGLVNNFMSSVPNHQTGTPTVVVHEDCTNAGEASHIYVKITTTKRNDADDNDVSITQEDEEATSGHSRNDASFEEELLPLQDDDKTQLESIMMDCRDGPSRSSRIISSGKDTMRKPASFSKIVSDDCTLQQSTEKSQQFLNQYAKKSKLFGYVVKNRTSVVAPRESKKSYRSPCITYQELVSIKANIKQHESRTRLLLQRSAKLSKYVDKLANGSDMRKHLHGF